MERRAISIKPGFDMVVKNRVTIFLNGQFIIVYTCKPHINHKYSLVIITPRISVLKCCISADEKDRDSIFTTVATIWKLGFRLNFPGPLIILRT